MILSGDEIRQAIEQGSISVFPEPGPIQYSGSSLDLHVGDSFLRWDEEAIAGLTEGGLSNVVDPSVGNFRALASRFAIPVAVENDGSCVIRPGEFFLATTRETVELPRESRIAARVEGRSSLARMGLMVHLTAPTIHVGWSGKIALEMFNAGPWPLTLRPNELPICQLIFERVGESAPDGQASQFQGQVSPAGG